MTRVITAPEPLTNSDPGLFLAGGITGCPDWQSEAIALFDGPGPTLYNPRRAEFDVTNPNLAPEQIAWEYNALRAAGAILFWFPAESIQPIALYELGAWSMTTKPLFLGAHPEYPRVLDVAWQTALARPDVDLNGSLRDLVDEVMEWWT